MEINVVNNVPGIKVTLNKSENGFAILLAEESKKTLGDAALGSIVNLCNREFIVLGHADETTAVISKDFAKEMKFGDSGDYFTSDVRKYCNNEFYKELASAVGANNIIKHTVKLVADDGTGKGKTCCDNVSVLTTENYRRYREFLKPYGDWWWTATRVTYDDTDYSHDVCYVRSNGLLDWHVCGYYRGVRPFCILNSSVLVSRYNL